jgi:hypothetical protein
MSWAAVAVGVGTLAAGIISKPKAPKVAPIQQINPQDEQAAAVKGNLANLDSIEHLTARSNDFMQSQANSLAEKAMPGYAKVASRFMQLADQNLQNPSELPKDVADNLERLAAERGISTGIRGQASDYSLLRDFGINSINFRNQQIGQAQSMLQTVASLAPRVNPLSPMSFYISPETQLNARVQNVTGAQAVQQGAYNAEAAARNQTASMWGQAVGTAAGAFGGYMNNRANTPKTTNTNPDAGGLF